MDSQWIWSASILFVNTALALLVAAALTRSRRVPGRNDLVLALVMLAVWAFCYAMVILSVSPDAKFFWFKFQHVGIVSQPVFWFLSSLNYTVLNRAPKRPWLVALWIVPVVSLAALFFQERLHLYYVSVEVAPAVGGPLIAARGTGYWSQWILTNLLHIVSAVLLLRWFFANRHLYRWRLGLLVAAVLVPWPPSWPSRRRRGSTPPSASRSIFRPSRSRSARGWWARSCSAFACSTCCPSRATW